MRRLTVLGEASKGGPPFRGPSGLRLARLAGLEFEDLAGRVRFRNLLPEWPGKDPRGKGDLWPVAEARERARSIRLTGDVLFAGRRVAGAFGVSAPYLEWVPFRGKRAAVFPHPSGINRWWNDPARAAEAGRFLREALGLPV